MTINDKAREDLLQEVDSLTDEEINKKPAENEWSIAQVLEHLVLMEGGITQTIAEHYKTGEENHVEDKPIELSVNRSTKVDAPHFAVPSEDYKTLAELKAKLDHTHAALRSFAESSNDSILESKSYPHPAFGKMNLKQWIPFVAYHEMRHTDQIREVKRKLGLA